MTHFWICGTAPHGQLYGGEGSEEEEGEGEDYLTDDSLDPDNMTYEVSLLPCATVVVLWTVLCCSAQCCSVLQKRL